MIDRSEEKIAIIEAYLKATNQLRDFSKADQDPKYTKVSGTTTKIDNNQLTATKHYISGH